MALFKQDMSLLSGPTAISGGSSADPASNSATGVRAVYPLTSSQEGIWIEYVADPLSTKYNLTLEWDLSNGERSWDSISTVIRAIRKLTERHSVLRSVICVLDSKGHVEEHDPESAEPAVRIVFRETASLTEPSVATILRQPFNLRTEYPARWVLLQDASTYRLFLVAHHIAVDGGSMSILSQEFVQLMDDSDASLPPPIDFSRMHLLERAWRRTSAYHNNKTFFMSQIQNQNQPEPAPAAPSPTREEYRKIQPWSTFSKKDLDAWGTSYRTSWFRIAVSLIGLLVADRTRPPLGRDETLAVAFGGRPPDFRRCVGQFANALPVRIPLWRSLLESPPGESESGTLRTLVKAVSANVGGAKRAELFPPVEVARCSRARNVEYAPPRVAVTYSPKLARGECRLFPVEGAWELFFCFLEGEEDVKLGVIYDPSLFSDAALGAMRSQLETLIDVSKTVTTRLADMLSWIPAHPSVPRALSAERPCRHVHQWFDAHAESKPNNVALYSAELKQSVTYGELYEESEEKARVLQRKGVCPGDTVAINLRRGLHVIHWILATLKAGAAFVYLNPTLAEARRGAILANSKPVLVVDDLLDDMASSWVFASEPSDEGSQSGSSSSGVETKWTTSDSDLAYIIYTSGSTGKPKGVMVQHGNLSSFVTATKDVFAVGYGARVLQLASFSFDASVLEWAMALCTGSCLCFAEHPQRLVGDYLADIVEQNRVTFMEITPTALETLPVRRDLPSLRQISVGGEAGSRELFETWHSRVDLVNAYGPTEGAIAVCYHKIDRGDAFPEVISAGHTNPRTTIYISNDSFTRILGRGQEGEVCIAGDQVVRGYRGQPDLTNEKFRAHPANGVHVYRTGDRGVLLEDGSLMLLGRMDRELKLRGFRIAPEEVEKAIMGSGTGFTEASVHLSVDGLALEAFVAPLKPSTEELSRVLKSKVPAYMVPGTYHRVESLPKNTSGKIDHKAVQAIRGSLRKPDAGSQKDSVLEVEEDSDDYSEVDEPGEAGAVAEIWQAVLGVSTPPKTNVNFFDIGGHSLLVPRLNQRLRHQFPLSTFRMVDLFHQSTIEQQAALVTTTKPTRKTRVRSMKAAKLLASPLTPPSPLSTPPSGIALPTTQQQQQQQLATSQPTPQTDDEIAVIGMSGRFPGAQDADAFYTQLLHGYNGITASSNPHPTKSPLPGNIWVNRGGTLSATESFDHRFWNLSREDATDMDPQQRLFLEVAYEALLDAGIDTRSSATDGSRIGIFVGAAQHAYHLRTESVLYALRRLSRHKHSRTR